MVVEPMSVLPCISWRNSHTGYHQRHSRGSTATFLLSTTWEKNNSALRHHQMRCACVRQPVIARAKLQVSLPPRVTLSWTALTLALASFSPPRLLFCMGAAKADLPSKLPRKNMYSLPVDSAACHLASSQETWHYSRPTSLCLTFKVNSVIQWASTQEHGPGTCCTRITTPRIHSLVQYWRPLPKWINVFKMKEFPTFYTPWTI